VVVVQGDLILDMCAAPGGKTTHIATLAHDRARIFALDKNVSKGTLSSCAAWLNARKACAALTLSILGRLSVEGIRRLCQRLGITSVEALTLDATKALLPDLQPDQACLSCVWFIVSCVS
jgi:hypothetical protein